ncbi:MAG: putative toxin-antitoxin system toxin component, PIN family [Candidatus Aenigmarchaeota archaeon]|nr:putative toxin-antitoxin system toxin component, PIN family [Candidatus Aenigmarchaeota archaeon]
MGKVKVVFDTNVWISIFTKKTLSKEFSEILEKELVSVYISEEILKEITKVLFYPKIEELLNLSGVNERDILRNITSISNFVKPKFKLKVIKEDPEDNKILDCAMQVKVDFIISGDRHLLKLKKFRNTKIVTPREFLDIIVE